MAKILLDSAGLQHYDAKIKGYMEGRLQAVLDALAGALRLRGVLKPEPNDAGVIEVVMDTVSQNPSVGDTYFFKLAATSDGKEQNAVVYYHDESGAELFDEVQNGDAIICTAERDITVTPNIPASWAILNSNWAFTAGEDGQTIEFTRDKINAIDLGVLNGVPLKFNIPTAQSAAYQLEESLIERNFVHISDVKTEENNGGTITTSINTESPTDTLIPTEKAVSEYVKKYTGGGAITNLEVEESMEGDTAIAIKITGGVNDGAWLTIPSATENLPGVMTGADKWDLSQRKEQIIGLSNSTIPIIQGKIKAWLETPNRCCGHYFRSTLNDDFIKKWNEGDTETIIPAGRQYVFELIATCPTRKYASLRVATYQHDSKILYTVSILDGVWGSLEKVAYTSDSVSAKSSDQGVEVELSGTLASPTVKVNVTSSGITSDNNSVAIASDVFKYAAKNEVFKGAKAETSSSVAEAGKVGLVPAPASGATTKYLRSDGNWSDVNNSVLWDGRRYQYVSDEKSSEYVKVMTIFVYKEYQDGVISFSVGGRGDTVRSNVSLTLTSSPNIDTTVIQSFVYYGEEKRCVDFSVYDFGVTTVSGMRGRILEIWYHKRTNRFDISAISNVYHTSPYVTITVDMLNQSAAPELTPVKCTLATVSLKAKYDADGKEINKTYVKKADTIKTTYDTDKGVKVELSGTFDAPKIDVTTTFGNVAISNSSNAVSGETIAKSVPLLVGGKGSIIVEGNDLNTAEFCISGSYTCQIDSTASRILNTPTEIAFTMTVYSPIHEKSITGPYAYKVRKIMNYRGEEWVQRASTDKSGNLSFSSWYRILKEDTTFTQATTSTANGTQVVVAGTGGAVPAPQTLADNDKFLRGNGTWSAIPTSSVGSGITLPATGNAVHEALTGTTYINTIGTDFIDNLFTAKG